MVRIVTLMKTRIEKWAKYRAKIANTPDYKFKSKPHFSPTSKEEAALLLDKASASSAVNVSALPKKKPTPFGVYLSKKRNALILKFVLLGATIIGLILLWFFWVIK